MEVILDFFSGNAEYFKRIEYLSICHISLNNVKYAVVRGSKNIEGVEKWISEDEKVIFEDDPILKDYIIKDYGLVPKNEGYARTKGSC